MHIAELKMCVYVVLVQFLMRGTKKVDKAAVLVISGFVMCVCVCAYIYIYICTHAFTYATRVFGFVRATILNHKSLSYHIQRHLHRTLSPYHFNVICKKQVLAWFGLVWFVIVIFFVS